MTNLKPMIPTMTSSEIRSRFIEYFKKNQHTAVSSSSLIPDKDPTLLFTNAGMNQFKNTFLGLEKRDYTRAVSSQKCVRAGGKHNDLDNVGFTARHHTFFEMLGNFSFGDYFKKEAIHFAWEFLTKELGIPKERLYVTVFQNDDEAAQIWHEQEGIPKERIFRFGEKDNFWRMGETGPCGPCTEIFYDHGDKAGPETDAYKGIASGGDRYVEIWNLVMMQYFEKAPGVLEPLPKPSVDTGAGLERLSAVMQGQINNYNTDLFLPLIKAALTLIPENKALKELIQQEDLSSQAASSSPSGTKGPSAPSPLAPSPLLQEQLASLRVLADHTRAVTFLLADGAIPSNEGRGYVLRRILRRALRYQKKLSNTASFFPVMIEALVKEMGDFYPEIKERKAYILNVVQEEESRFIQTLDQGTELLNEELNRLRKSDSVPQKSSLNSKTSAGSVPHSATTEGLSKVHSSAEIKMVPGEVVFKLYDTFGFPVDLTKLMAEEQGFQIDEAGFEKEMQAARQKAKASWKTKSLNTNEAHLIQWSNSLLRQHHATEFIGYDHLHTIATKVIGLSNGQTAVEALNQGDQGLLVTTTTPFYAEGGGQVGDRGIARINNPHSSSPTSKSLSHPSTSSSTSPSHSPLEIMIYNTTKQNDIYLHHIEVTQGTLQIGTSVEMIVNESERRQVACHHSATHLLHAALRKTLGNHITQAGSLVDAIRLRFDFTHPKSISAQELEVIEQLVNEEIAKNTPVQDTIKTQADAIKEGAMALFGEKYGDKVRVIQMGDFSQELCGGIHVKNTAQLRTFVIVSEGGVSAGVRRIEALAGEKALAFLKKYRQQFQAATEATSTTENWSQFLESTHSPLLHWIDETKNHIKFLEKEIKDLKRDQIDLESLISKAQSFSKGSAQGRYVIAAVDIDDRELLAQITDQLKNRLENGVIITLGRGTDSHPLIIAVTKNMLPTLNAGQILKELSQKLGGKGGGRPDFAQGAITQRDEVTPVITDYFKT